MGQSLYNCKKTLTHDQWVRKLVKINDSQFAALDIDSTLLIWNIENNNKFRVHKTLNTNGGQCISYQPNKGLISLSYYNLITIYDTIEYKIKKDFKANQVGVLYFYYLSNDQIVCCSTTDRIQIWNSQTAQCSTVITGENFHISSMILLTNSLIAASSFDETIKIFNSHNFALHTELYGHTNEVHCLVKLNDNLFASGCSNGQIRLWSINSLKCLSVLSKNNNGTVYCMIKLNESQLASGNGDRTIKIWDYKSSKCLSVLTGHSNVVFCLMALNEHEFASGSGDNTIKIWTSIKEDKEAFKEIE